MVHDLRGREARRDAVNGDGAEVAKSLRPVGADELRTRYLAARLVTLLRAVDAADFIDSRAALVATRKVHFSVARLPENIAVTDGVEVNLAEPVRLQKFQFVTRPHVRAVGENPHGPIAYADGFGTVVVTPVNVDRGLDLHQLHRPSRSRRKSTSRLPRLRPGCTA